MAAAAGTIVLGPRIGRFVKGKPVKMVGHSMILQVLGLLILWVGWMGFNPGSSLGVVGRNVADVAVNTNLAGAAAVLGAMVIEVRRAGTRDTGVGDAASDYCPGLD